MDLLLPDAPPSLSAADALARLRQFVLGTATPDRDDRLWPSDFMAFASNPLSLGYGAAGTALFLHQTGGLPADALPWIEARLAEQHLPPGLYTGASGVAMVLSEIGRHDLAAPLLRQATGHALLESDATWFQGGAGVGWACLHAAERSGDRSFVALAEQSADQLLASAEASPEGLSWAAPTPRTPTDELTPRPLGLARGSSGVALFLTVMAHASGEDRYAKAARRALEFDLAHADASGDALRWGADTEATGTSPYWTAGTAGVGLALLRYAELTGDAEMLAAASGAGRGSRALFAGYPGHFEGMSGIGHFLLDLHAATGDADALAQAEGYGQSILCFRIEREDGTVAFPGRGLSRIANDYGSGGAGVGLYLARLHTPSTRSFYDLP